MCTGNTRPSWNLAHVDWDDNDPMENERTVRLPDVLRKTGPKLIDTYDPGDSWKHAIVLEKQLPVDPAAKYPVCTDGQLACPPENCGGIPGFYDLVEAIADPNHEQHKELKDWLGYDLEPIDFSIDCVNQMLLPARRCGKTAKTVFLDYAGLPKTDLELSVLRRKDSSTRLLLLFLLLLRTVAKRRPL